MRRNIVPLKTKMKKKKEDNFKLKSLVKSLKEKVLSKNEKNMFIFKKITKLKEERKTFISVLDSALSNLHRS